MIKIIRSFLVLLSFFIFGIGAVILNFTLFPLAKFFIKDKNLLYFYSDVIHSTWAWFVKLIISFGIMNLNIEDLAKIKQIKNKVIVSTHPSFIDIVILIGLIPRTTCIVKSALAQNLILSNLVSSIFILEDETLDNMKNHTKKMLDNGFNVVIFPSGIRHRKNEYPKIHKGAATIAMNAKANIVALKLYTDFDFLFINQPIYEAGELKVNYELSYVGEIDVKSELEKTDNEIVIKKNITKMIENVLMSCEGDATIKPRSFRSWLCIKTRRLIYAAGMDGTISTAPSRSGNRRF